MVVIVQCCGHFIFFFVIGRAISGPQLASLLEILVMAANEGSLAEVLKRLMVNLVITGSGIDSWTLGDTGCSAETASRGGLCTVL